MKQRVTALLLALVLLTGLCTTPALGAEDGLEGALAGSAAYMLNTVKTPQVGSTGGEWAVLGLARSGADVPQSYWESYYAAVEDYMTACEGVLHERKYTEYARLALALTAIGADPTNVAGYDLLVPLGDYDMTIWQGLNGPIWALIALDSGNYDMPTNPDAATQATRQRYIDRILTCQLADGGWNLTDEGGGAAADPDITAMALQALANYRSQSAVKAATDRALTCLSAAQHSDGGFSSWGTSNLESCVQVLVALCELGVSLEDSRFVKEGNSVLDAVLGYRRSSGGFLHTADGSGSSQMASEQGLYALAAVHRARTGASTLYRMDDVTITLTGGARATVGLPGKRDDVTKVAVSSPGVTFEDISGHANQLAIEALAARGIITGKSAGSFDPDATMTRAEFAAIVVRALGLTSAGGAAGHTFSDVPQSRWYYSVVTAAAGYGIITGRGEGIFDPEGTITRQEAAVMVARAAGLCGMDTGLESAAVRDILAQFGDYTTVASWARESLAFCYRADILDQSDLNVEPVRAILRCQIAQMLYNTLDSAKLL